jgi:hypothetical protein
LFNMGGNLAAAHENHCQLRRICRLHGPRSLLSMRVLLFLSSCRAAIIPALALALWVGAGSFAAAAAQGPFASFHGRWSGSGTMHSNGKTERMRCEASYRPLGSSGHEIDLSLKCDSDTYKFNLSGRFQADEGNHVSGQWTEHTRNVGGIVVGNVHGSRFDLHVESSAFTADMGIVTNSSRQSVSISAQGGGQIVKASLTLRQR